MSKSLGNFFLLRDVLEHYDGRIIRLFILSSHYRKPIDFSDAELTQAKTSLERIENAVMRGKEALVEISSNGSSCVELKEQLALAKEKFVSAMDEDFNTSMGLGAIFELVKELNKAVDSPINSDGAEVVKESIEYIDTVMSEVLGVKLKLENAVGNLTSELVEFILEMRREARAEKNWAMSDKIRDRLAEMGIKIKDGKDKTTWTM